MVQLLYFTPAFVVRILYIEIASLKALGFLTIGLMLSQIINLFTSSISNQLAPEIREFIKQNDRIKLKWLLENSAFFPSLLMVPFLMVVYFNFNFVLTLLGDQYVTDIALEIMFCVILGAVVNTLTGATGTVLMLSSRSHFEIFTGVVKAFSTIAVFWLLFSSQPVLSVPIALAAGEIAANVVKAFLVYYAFRITPWSWKNFSILVAVIIIIFFSANEIMRLGLSDFLTFTSHLVLGIIAILFAVLVQFKWT